jgi:AraC-like DNA-binding protein
MAQDKTLTLQKSQALPFVEMRDARGSSACYHTHSHDEFSFGVIDQGSANYLNMKHAHQIHQGHTVTINPGDAHSCNPKEGAWSFRMLFVETQWIANLQQEMLSNVQFDYQPFSQHYKRNISDYRQFSTLFESLKKETNLLTAEGLLIDYFADQFSKSNHLLPEKHRVDIRSVSLVKEMILDQLDANISLDEFAKQAELSRYHLIRSFKSHYGQSPHAFQLDQRIKKAKQLLQQGNSLVNTASQLGFSDQSHFQRHFKKRLAITPKQYQGFFL